MNKVLLIGRLVADPEIRQTNGEKPIKIAHYRLAVDRKYKKEGAQSADFINCVAYGKGGEFAERYLKKGIKIAVEGRIQSGSYEKDGKTVYTFDVAVDSHEFCESKQSGSTAAAPADYDYPGDPLPSYSGFQALPGDDSDLPF